MATRKTSTARTSKATRKVSKPKPRKPVSGQGELFLQEKERKSTLGSKLAALKPKQQAPHLVVEALAGTGKTTTLIEGLKFLKGLPTSIKPSPQQQTIWDSLYLSRRSANTVAFVAFNKSIAEELRSRVPPGCDAMTMHSMGMKAVMGSLGRLYVNSGRESKTAKLVSQILELDLAEIRKHDYEMLKAVEQLVGLCKKNLIEPDDESLAKLAAHYDVELNGKQAKVFDLVPEVLAMSCDRNNITEIDFDDMIWLPVKLDLPLTKYDLLLVDEAQDLNRCQQAIAKKAGRRLVFVGDKNQAIYGFAGADAESLDRLKRELSVDDCQVLPLTVTRRCGEAIVAEAQKIVPTFEGLSANGKGEVLNKSLQEDSPDNYRTLVENGDMVVCRCNAPLVSECFRFLKAKRQAKIIGRDIASGLIALINKMKAQSVSDLLNKLDDYTQKEIAKETERKNGSDARIINLQDRYDCIECLCEDLYETKDVIDLINQIFTDDAHGEGIRLSSVHKAKGLEAPSVYILMPPNAPMPHYMARSAWQMEQEMNLKYVAITRAIKRLVWVS